MNTVQNQFVVSFALGTDQVRTVKDIIPVLTGVIPSVLRGADPYGNATCLLGDTRISTFVCFYSKGEHDVSPKVLVWGRPAGMQENLNHALDAFGAVAYNNASLVHKLPQDFMNARVISILPVQAIAIEQTDKESVVMVGHMVQVFPKDLHIGVIEGKSFVTTPEDLLHAQPMTAKLQASLKEFGYSF